MHIVDIGEAIFLAIFVIGSIFGIIKVLFYDK
jgi:hypothetical protein